MARTAEELKAHILSQGPAWLCEPDEVMEAVLDLLCAQFARVEAAQETLHARTFICESDGDWLDQHGMERGVLRFDGESDAVYQPRVKVIEDQVTPPAILGALDEILFAGTARMEEHLADGAYADFAAPQGFSDLSRTYDELRCFTVFVAEQLVRRNDTAYALPQGATIGTLSYAGTFAEPDVSAFADADDPTPSEIYGRIYRTIDRMRAAGVTFRVEIE